MSAARVQRLAAAGLCAGALALLGWRCACSPEVAFVHQHGKAAWITDPQPVDARTQQWGRAAPPVARFVARFPLAAAPVSASLRLRAARAWRVQVNGVAIAASPDPDPAWRRDRVLEVGAALRPGPNEIEVAVWNPRGPPLLRARLEWPGGALATGPDWQVSIDGGPPRAAALPDDTRPHPSAILGPRPARALRERGLAFAGILLGAWAGWLAAGAALARRPERAPALALAAVHLAWLGLFATSFLALPLRTGFDASGHLEYVALLRERGALPLATEGWSTYHPPLYYALVAALQEGAAAFAPGWEVALTKLPSFAAGLAQAWLAWALAAVLVPGRPLLAAVGVLFAGALPLNLYASAYVSNEPLHAAAFGLAVWLCARALARPSTEPRALLGAGAALGVALLVKVTALVAAAVATGVVLGRAAVVERVRPARLAGLAAALGAPVLALAGWWYLRQWLAYGSPLAGNWNLPGRVWWSQPGFHGWGYYLGFGEALRLPVFAGFRSFADALYSSFWGDGWAGGRATAAALPPWDWQWAALGYWLALPATGVLLVGVGESARRAFGPGPRRAAWSFVLGLEGALALAFVALTLELPYFGQAKALYLLGLVAPLAVQFALGAQAAETRLARLGGPAAVAAGRAWLTATGLVFLLSFVGP